MAVFCLVQGGVTAVSEDLVLATKPVPTQAQFRAHTPHIHWFVTYFSHCNVGCVTPHKIALPLSVENAECLRVAAIVTAITTDDRQKNKKVDVLMAVCLYPTARSGYCKYYKGDKTYEQFSLLCFRFYEVEAASSWSSI